jgi:protein tyrosine phosphatase/ribosomal protein S18 acetylase RimI-like enzyme
VATIKTNVEKKVRELEPSPSPAEPKKTLTAAELVKSLGKQPVAPDPKIKRFVDACKKEDGYPKSIDEVIEELSKGKGKQTDWIWAFVPQAMPQAAFMPIDAKGKPIEPSMTTKKYAFKTPAEAEAYFSDPYLRNAYGMVISGMFQTSWEKIPTLDKPKVLLSLLVAEKVIIKCDSTHKWKVKNIKGEEINFYDLIQTCLKQIPADEAHATPDAKAANIATQRQHLALSFAPEFHKYAIGKYDEGTEDDEKAQLTHFSLRPANLFLRALFGGQDVTTMPGTGGSKLAFNFPINVTDSSGKHTFNSLEEIGAWIMSRKDTGTKLSFSFSGVTGTISSTKGKQDLSKYFGKQTFELSISEIQAMLQSQKVFMTATMPEAFYLGLKAAMKKDEMTVFPGGESRMVMVQDILNAKGQKSLQGKKAENLIQFFAEVTAAPEKFGFTLDQAKKAAPGTFSYLQKLTLYQLGSMVVRSQDYFCFIGENGQLRDRKAGSDKPLRLIDCCGIRGFLTTENLSVEGQKTDTKYKHAIDKEILKNNFKNMLRAAERGYLCMPAIGLGVWAQGQPENIKEVMRETYWSAFFEAVDESPDTGKLDCIFVNPNSSADPNGKRFDEILESYKVKNPNFKVKRMDKDILCFAENLRAEFPRTNVSIVNASDPDCTLGRHICEYMNNQPHGHTTEENMGAAGSMPLCFEDITGMLTRMEKPAMSAKTLSSEPAWKASIAKREEALLTAVKPDLLTATTLTPDKFEEACQTNMFKQNSIFQKLQAAESYMGLGVDSQVKKLPRRDRYPVDINIFTAQPRVIDDIDINATLMYPPDSDKPAFIATQCPTVESKDPSFELDDTRGDFLYMVAHAAPLDKPVMLIRLTDELLLNGLQNPKYNPTKYSTYWPKIGEELKLTTQTGQELTVTKVEENPQNAAKTIIEHKFMVTVKGEPPREVTLLECKAWPDFGDTDMENAKLLLDHIGDFRKKNPEVIVPVHCSAGVGRSSTLIGLQMAIEQINKKKDENPSITPDEMRALIVTTWIKTVAHLKAQRKLSVQQDSQFVMGLRYLQSAFLAAEAPAPPKPKTNEDLLKQAPEWRMDLDSSNVDTYFTSKPAGSFVIRKSSKSTYLCLQIKLEKSSQRLLFKFDALKNEFVIYNLNDKEIGRFANIADITKIIQSQLQEEKNIEATEAKLTTGKATIESINNIAKLQKIKQLADKFATPANQTIAKLKEIAAEVFGSTAEITITNEENAKKYLAIIAGFAAAAEETLKKVTPPPPPPKNVPFAGREVDDDNAIALLAELPDPITEGNFYLKTEEAEKDGANVTTIKFETDYNSLSADEQKNYKKYLVQKLSTTKVKITEYIFTPPPPPPPLPPASGKDLTATEFSIISTSPHVEASHISADQSILELKDFKSLPADTKAKIVAQIREINKGIKGAMTKDQTWDDHGVHKYLEEPDTSVYISFSKNASKEYVVSGYAIYKTQTTYLDAIAVHPDHRKKGIGKYLMNLIMVNHCAIKLDVRADDAVALKLYRSASFQAQYDVKEQNAAVSQYSDVSTIQFEITQKLKKPAEDFCVALTGDALKMFQKICADMKDKAQYTLRRMDFEFQKITDLAQKKQLQNYVYQFCRENYRELFDDYISQRFGGQKISPPIFYLPHITEDLLRQKHFEEAKLKEIITYLKSKKYIDENGYFTLTTFNYPHLDKFNFEDLPIGIKIQELRDLFFIEKKLPSNDEEDQEKMEQNQEQMINIIQKLTAKGLIKDEKVVRYPVLSDLDDFPQIPVHIKEEVLAKLCLCKDFTEDDLVQLLGQNKDGVDNYQISVKSYMDMASTEAEQQLKAITEPIDEAKYKTSLALAAVILYKSSNVPDKMELLKKRLIELFLYTSIHEVPTDKAVLADRNRQYFEDEDFDARFCIGRHKLDEMVKGHGGIPAFIGAIAHEMSHKFFGDLGVSQDVGQRYSVGEAGHEFLGDLGAFYVLTSIDNDAKAFRDELLYQYPADNKDFDGIYVGYRDGHRNARAVMAYLIKDKEAGDVTQFKDFLKQHIDRIIDKKGKFTAKADAKECFKQLHTIISTP